MTDLIPGNDLASGTVFTRPVVSYKPSTKNKPYLAENFPSAFPACAVTRAQSKKFEDVVDLSNSFLVKDPKSVKCVLSIIPDPDLAVASEKLSSEYAIEGGVVYQGLNQTNQDSIKAWLKHEEPNSTKGRTRQQQEVVNQIPSSSPSENSLNSKPFSQNSSQH